jgi:hypothetical protein
MKLLHIAVYQNGPGLHTIEMGEKSLDPRILTSRFCTVFCVKSVKGISPCCVEVDRSFGNSERLDAFQHRLELDKLKAMYSQQLRTLATLRILNDLWASARLKVVVLES